MKRQMNRKKQYMRFVEMEAISRMSMEIQSDFLIL